MKWLTTHLRITRTCIYFLVPITLPRLLSLQDKNVDCFENIVVRDIMDILHHLNLSADPVSATPSSLTVAQVAEDEVDAEIRQLRLRIHQAEYVHKTMTAKVQQLERKLDKPKDEEVAMGEEQEREVGQAGEIMEGREKTGREKDGERVLEEEEEDGAGGQEAFELNDFQQVGRGVSLNGEREKKAEGVWGQQEGEWAGRGGGGGGRAHPEEQEREVGQAGEIMEGREKTGREKDGEGV